MTLLCASRIRKVTVHARGALVTRALALPELPDGDVELLVPELTAFAEPASVRASLDGTARQVVALQTTLHFPETASPPGETPTRVRDLTRRLERLRAELARLGAHRLALAEATPAPRLRRAGRADGAKVEERVADALAASGLLAATLAGLDTRSGELEDAVRELERELEAARLADAQASSRARMGAGHPTRAVTLRLAGAGPVGAAELSYVVPAARWWPVYTLRFSDGGKRVSWLLEALVAQLTGEDWGGVELALSTADLVRDVRLPELASRRLGRAQAPARRGYRPAPAGLGRLFAGYDRAFAGSSPPPVPTPPPVDDLVDRVTTSFDVDEEVTRPGTDLPRHDSRSTQVVRAVPPTTFAPPPMPAPLPPPAPTPVPIAPSRAVFGGTARTMMVAGGLPKPAAPASPPPEPTEPADAWLDFDALTMAAPGEPQRGRLRRAPPPPTRAAEADATIGSLAPGPAVADVLATRGHFDHTYAAAGACDVPADGLAHRVTVGMADAAPTMRWRTVPRESPSVYREAEIANPFAAPLLAGPVDVYVEGSLLLTTGIQHLDRGGKVTLGLGVEDRIRVARNARVDEGSAGLLGGSTEVTADVTVDLTSALGGPARVDVVDRIPVSDDKTVEIQLVSSSPRAEEYSQAERGAPIRGGLAWRVEVPPGGKTRVAYQYRLSFSAKSEIVGGNRRD